MMKRAVMYGGGNIGRGFIGALLSASGYRVTFVDVADAVVNGLNEKGEYPLRILSSEGYEDRMVTNVCAVNGKDAEAVAEVISEADIMATSVGAKILPYIVPNIVAGIRARIAKGGAPLNLLICENLMDANEVLKELITPHLSAEELAWFNENFGLVETSIGRMVPVQTEQMRDGEPLRVCVESYGFLPVDKAAFRGEIPEIDGMVPFSPFDFFVKRKLYLHNMGHATCAYLGDVLGLAYIYEAIDEEAVCSIVRGAMTESARALSGAYGVELERLLRHIDDLLYRFTNRALMDTCLRVGGDPARKLSPKDRLIGAATLCEKQGILPCYIAIGAAAALRRLVAETEGAEQSIATAKKLLSEVSGLAEGSTIFVMIIENYGLLLDGATPHDLRRVADRLKAAAAEKMI